MVYIPCFEAYEAMVKYGVNNKDEYVRETPAVKLAKHIFDYNFDV